MKETQAALGKSLSPAMLEMMRKQGVDPARIEGLKEHLTRTELHLSQFITQDPQMIAIKNQVRKLVDVDDPVLIHGESGTGKELIANALHGTRRGKFVAINCAGIPSELLESELFGHKRGSFTGAHADKIGLMQEAQGGTLFLDEIGDMPRALQSKMLRAIQDRKIKRVGDNRQFEINCRIVSATNMAIEDPEVFRSDLYYRLAIFKLTLTPLRFREKDIPLILRSLFEDEDSNAAEILTVRLRAVLGQQEELEPHCRDKILPGNVRQLQAIVRRYQVLKLEPHGNDWF